MPRQVARHHVHVIELDPAVLQHAKFCAAQRMEWVLARELRSDGHAVWQK